MPTACGCNLSLCAGSSRQPLASQHPGTPQPASSNESGSFRPRLNIQSIAAKSFCSAVMSCMIWHHHIRMLPPGRGRKASSEKGLQCKINYADWSPGLGSLGRGGEVPMPTVCSGGLLAIWQLGRQEVEQCLWQRCFCTT